MSFPAKAKIDLAALRSNYALADSMAPGSNTIAVVKANAYGHGAVRCAQELQQSVPAFGVCFIEEALQLRHNAVHKPVLILRSAFTSGEIQAAADNDFWLMAYEDSHLEAIDRQALSRPLTIWLKADTGMHRLGLDPARLRKCHERLLGSANVKSPVVLATHFSCADDVRDPFTLLQIERFRTATAGLDVPVSMANSAGVMAWPDAHGDWNRPGIMLYGSSPMKEPCAAGQGLKPVMQLQSAVIALRTIDAGETVGYTGNWIAPRTSRIATVAIGYADGYPRHAPNGTPVLVNGHRAPLAGRVSMDMITVDVTDLPDTRVGDRVILWGPGLPVSEVASAAGTIAYELLTQMTGRVELEYR